MDLDTVDGHQNYEHDGPGQKVDNVANGRGQRIEQSREVDFRDEVLIANQARARGSPTPGKEQVDQDGAVGEDRVRMSVRGHSGEIGEEKYEDSSREKRLENEPGGAEDGLFVADSDVAHCEHPAQLAELP